MTEPAKRLDPRFPGVAPDVVDGYLSAPAHMTAEILDGELHVQSRPRLRHARAGTRLVGALRGFDDDDGTPGGWVILIEPELELGPRPDIVDPDLAGWHRARLPRLPDDAAIALPPDWVCEILSSSTEAIDRGKKMRIYRREGVGHIWLLSPEHRTLEVYRLENGRYSLLDTHEGDGAVQAEPYEAIALSLARLWAR